MKTSVCRDGTLKTTDKMGMTVLSHIPSTYPLSSYMYDLTLVVAIFTLHILCVRSCLFLCAYQCHAPTAPLWGR